jgi:hypothetical protein
MLMDRELGVIRAAPSNSWNTYPSHADQAQYSLNNVLGYMQAV